MDWVWRFGLQSGNDVDKFSGLTTRSAPSGCLILTDAIGWLDCRVETRMEIGDRTVYLAQVMDGKLEGDEPALTMTRLVQLASDDRLAELKKQMLQDIIIDAREIISWRRLTVGS